MRVGVDGRSLVGGGPRGVANYTSALLAALAAGFPEDEWRVLLPRGRARTLPPGVAAVRHRAPGRVLFGAAATAGRPRLDRLLDGGLDVVWAPAPAPLAVSADVPLVLTVHDRSWELRPGDFTRYERLWHRLARPRRLARGAGRVLCDAEAIRAELIGAWGLDPDRVRVAPLAPAPAPVAAAPSGPAARTGPGATEPYFLFAGALEPRKAPELLVDAWAVARARGLRSGLVIAGEGRLAARLARPGVRLEGRVEPERLGQLYAGAVALVAPSWLEGFGLPPVEALAHGTPPIVSDLPVFREVLKGGARYVPAGDAFALAAALLALERDPALRPRLVAAGRAAIAPLTWARTAQITRAVLAEAAE